MADESPSDPQGPSLYWQMQVNEYTQALERITELERQLAEATREVIARRAADVDGAWHWQGDGYDFPESLLCPVLMSAETLREFLAKLAEAQVAYATMVGQHDDWRRQANKLWVERDALKASLAEMRAAHLACTERNVALQRIIARKEAALEQAREALMKFGCVRPWIPASFADITGEPTCRNYRPAQGPFCVWPRENWCHICVALVALEARQEAGG